MSQVNEMLTWMESHPLPFACTTNFNERLDRATLRRFTFKIAMDYLSTKQARMAFRQYFGMPAPKGVAALRNLTPGDFPVVRRRGGDSLRVGRCGRLGADAARRVRSQAGRATPRGICRNAGGLRLPCAVRACSAGGTPRPPGVSPQTAGPGPFTRHHPPGR